MTHFLTGFAGPFKVINVDNEEKMLRYFISHIQVGQLHLWLEMLTIIHMQELKPHIIVTYNGDRFDWPYVESRCGKYSQLSLYENLGIRSIKGQNPSNVVKLCLSLFRSRWWRHRWGSGVFGALHGTLGCLQLGAA